MTAATADMCGGHIVRRVRQHLVRAPSVHGEAPSRVRERIATRQRQRSHRPAIAKHGERACRRSGQVGVRRIVITEVAAEDEVVDLGGLKARDLGGKVERLVFEDQFEGLGEHDFIPFGQFGDAVVRDHQRVDLRRRKRADPHGRNCAHPELLSGSQARMAGDQLAIGVQEDRRQIMEALHHLHQALDLRGAVLARIARVRLDRIGRDLLDWKMRERRY
jgi:hypothetical protein